MQIKAMENIKSNEIFIELILDLKNNLYLHNNSFFHIRNF